MIRPVPRWSDPYGPCAQATKPEPPRVWRARARACGCLMLLAATALLPIPARATGPVVWDEDGDGIDDRIGTVQALGFRYSFEDADSLLRQRFEVTRVGADLVYGVYVRYDHAPTTTDLLALTALGVIVQHRLIALPAVRVRATFVQILLVRQLAHVERIEAVPWLYGATHDGCAALGVRDQTHRVAPTVEATTPQADGQGIVVAILDSGINDATSGGYPGHEALIGRCVGGARFTSGDSLFDTPRNGSENPSDAAVGALAGHGTHVASIVLGSGGSSGYARGVAPAARFVDVQVLGGLGSGTGLPEALDWCIWNRARNWGGDPDYDGIDVLNLSLSSLDRSDGRDLASELCKVAAQSGIVVVASMGNDGFGGHVPSPAAGDGVIAVGSFDTQRSGRPEDDLAVTTDNTGPRDGDGDADALDELKPALLAPGVAVLAANGDLATDGTRYVRRSGTSMAAAFASGAAAALRSLDPALTPAQVEATLIATARRNGAGIPVGAPGPDPRWSAARGFGVLDLYAAVLERTETVHTQVRRLMMSATPTTITAEAWTMRERGAPYIVFERAPDLGGLPGTFVALDSLLTIGDPSLLDGDDTHEYARSYSVPPAEYGMVWWWRVATADGAERHACPAVRMAAPTGPSEATVYVTLVHDAYDTDVDAALVAGDGAYALPMPGSAAAISTDYVDGVSAFGTIALTFRLEVPAGAASAWLPPTAEAPWKLRLGEGGFLNRSGRLTRLEFVWHSPAGDLLYSASPVPLPTLEGATVEADIPAASTGVGTAAGLAPGASPNPVVGGGLLAFVRPTARPGPFQVYDVNGRRVVSIDVAAVGGSTFRWRAADASGRPLAPGVYLARFGHHRPIRFVVVSR